MLDALNVMLILGCYLTGWRTPPAKAGSSAIRALTAPIYIIVSFLVHMDLLNEVEHEQGPLAKYNPPNSKTTGKLAKNSNSLIVQEEDYDRMR